MTTVNGMAKATGLSYKAANDLVEQMIKSNILKETTGQSRNRLFVFDNYLNAFIKRITSR